MFGRLKITGIILLLLSAGSAIAQNELDAYRYSGTSIFGTARAVGVGGAFSAVGADFSATSLNPAGLAFYRRSDLMFTPTLRFVNNKSSYLGTESTDMRTRLGFTNVGYVYADRVASWNRETRSREEASSGLKSYAFSVGFNQIANYNRNTSAVAFNPESSITEYFATLANGYSFDEVAGQSGLAYLAWYPYAIDTSGIDGTWTGAANGGQVEQRFEINESGRNNEWSIGFAGNVDDFLYIGAVLGIQNIRYDYAMSLIESDINDVHNSWANDSTPMNTLTYTDAYATRGSGLNLRGGVILRPLDFLRVGVSFTSPTWMNLTDTYTADITMTQDGDPNNYGADALDGIYTYNLTTPWKVTAGAMVLLGKRGFISGDFEYTDYSTTAFASDVSTASPYYYAFTQENQAIGDQFSGAYNLRLGGEARFGMGRFRLGYANLGSILKKEYLDYYEYPSGSVNSITGSRHIFTGGLGVKRKSYYIDFAYARELRADRRLYYTVSDPAEYSPELINRTTASNFYMTIGFTF